MAVGLYQVPTQNNLQYTLNSSYTAGGGTLVLNQSVAGVVLAPGVCVVDRIDSSGNKTPTKRTYYSFTGVSGANLTGAVPVDGTDQTHSVGAILEFTPDVNQQQAIYDTFAHEHDQTTGNHASITTTGFTNSSLASLNNSVARFMGSSLASIGFLSVKDMLRVSGASLADFYPSSASGAVLTSIGNQILPVWATPSAGGGTGGFNALFQVPGALASQANIAGLIPVPVAFTAGFMQMFVQTPCSLASLSIVVKKNMLTVFGVATMLAGATFASSASFTNTALVAGDNLTMDINSTASSGQNLAMLLRAT